MITVQTNSRTERVCVMRLFEVTGVLAAEYHIDLSNGSATVAVNTLADGLYFAEIEDSNVRTARVPVIVRR